MFKIEKCVPKHPTIYRIFEVDDLGEERPTEIFRVRKRVKVDQRWTCRVRTFANFLEAKQFAKQPVVLEAHDERRSMKFHEVLERFFHFKEFEEKRAPGTIQGYRSRSMHFKFFEEYELSQITPKAVDAWTNLLLDPRYKVLQQSSRQDYGHELVLLTVVFRYYREFIDETFHIPILLRHRKRLCSSAKAKNEIRYLSFSEEQAFLQELKNWPVIYDLAVFQLHTGTRVGEAAAMMFDAVEFSQEQVHIKRHLHWDRSKGGQMVLLKGTKTGPDRTIPLTKECLEMLRGRFQTRSGEILFPNAKTGNWLSYRSIQNIYDLVFKRLELPLRGTHSLRHTFAVRFLEQTKDIYALQRAMGHKDLKVTQVYAKYADASVKKAFQIFRGGPTSETSVSKVVPILSLS